VKGEDWETGVLGCCDDINACCLGAFCPCVLYGMTKGLIGEDKVRESPKWTSSNVM
jgi:Cys-rich protein (TIGR01571 family)